MDAETQLELDGLIEEMRGLSDPRKATPQWKGVLSLLRKTDLDPNRVANVVARRSVDELVQLVAQLQAPPPVDAAHEPLPPGVDEQTLSSALKAFRKRLKFTRLDDESRIDSRNPLSKGEASEIRSIQPPFEWPREVWDALAKRGKLRYTGKGFFELTDEEA
jgi:hypothetical protein